MNGSCDPESKALWEELRSCKPPLAPLLGKEGMAEAEDLPCCHVLKRNIVRGIAALITYSPSGKLIFRHEINYCMQCGKKLT